MTTTSILTLDSVTCTLPDGRSLFSDLNASLDARHTALVGRNGVGKSLLGQILAGTLPPSSGRCLRYGRVHHLSQDLITQSATIAELAQVSAVLSALERIEQGSVDPADFDAVGERWTVRAQLHALLGRHGCADLDLQAPASTLSPGQAMRVAIIGAFLAQADYLILDEPSNHLDREGRRHLQALIEQWDRGLLLISHDRELLEAMQRTLELSNLGLRSYTGGYSAYAVAKADQQSSAERELQRLRQQRQQHLAEHQQQREQSQRQQARASNAARQANQAKILLGSQKQRSQTTAGKQQRHQQHTQEALNAQVREAAQQVERQSSITLQPPSAQRHAGKELLALDTLVLPYGHTAPLDLRVLSGERIAVTGANGAGKSTLLKVISGELNAKAGRVHVGGQVAVLDQHASLLRPEQSMLDHLRQANPQQDHSLLRTRLAQLGLDAARLELPSRVLSGGERVKVALAALIYRPQPVDLLLLDEPGNHLDLASLHALEHMLEQFQGALMVVSHDQVFLQRLALTRTLAL